MVGRLIIDEPREAAYNMAVDQAILDSVAEGAVPTLRLYRWSIPTLSLGYFQELGFRATHAASRTCPVVRRSTGGGAIVHHHELTYSLCLPIADRVSGAARSLYAKLHDAMRRTLRRWGVLAEPAGAAAESRSEKPFLCFQRRASEDLVVSGYKVLGSAQRRTGNAILQHGGLLLRASEFAPELPGVCDLAGQMIPIADLMKIFVDECQQEFPELKHLEQKSLSVTEAEAAMRWRTQRFEDNSWLTRR